MDQKKVKLRISRKKLEQMSKEEVFQFIESEREKYKEAREEAKRKRREEGGALGPGLAQRLAEGGWMVMVPLGLGIGVIIALSAIFIASFFSKEYIIALPEAQEFTIPVAALAPISADAIRIPELWKNNDYAQVVYEIDSFSQSHQLPEKLVQDLAWYRLQALYFASEFDVAVHYSQTLQNRYRSDTAYTNEVLWMRAHAFLAKENYYEAFRTFEFLSRQPGPRAVEAFENARHIQAELL